MTRNDFLEYVTTWEQLIGFCQEEWCDLCDDVYDEYDKDEHIDSSLGDWIDNANGWRELRETLNCLPDCSSDYYRQDEYGEWVGLDDDDDFDEYKEAVLMWGDDRDVWEEEENDEDEEWESEDEEDDCEPPEEDVPMPELLSICHSNLRDICMAEKSREAENEKNFFELLGTLT